MRILLVSPYFPPQAAVASLRVHSFATAWAAAGMNVTVLTTAKRDDQKGWPKPSTGYRVIEVPYRGSRVFEAVRGASRSASGSPAPRGENRDSGPAVRLLKPLVRRLHRFREQRGIFASVRMPDMTGYWVRPAVQWALEHGPWDLVFSSVGPYTAHLVGLAIKRAGQGQNWVLEFRDLWVGNPIHPGMFPFTLRERRLERQCCASADLVVTVSDPLADRLRSKVSCDVVVAYNGFDREELAGLPSDSIFPDDGVVRLLFTGSLYGRGQDPDPLLRALARCRDEEGPGTIVGASRLRLVIAGASCDVWQHRAERLGISDMLDIRGMVRRSNALRMQRDADGLVLVDFDPGVEGALTTKLFEYLSVTAPIIVVGGAGDTSMQRFLADSGRALFLGHEEGRIVSAVRALLDGRPLLETEPGCRRIEHYARDRQARLLLHRLQQVCDAESPSRSTTSGV